MPELVYRLSFATPAFLGNAEQQAQWRTPPLKALIRQWWRVVKAPHRDVAYDHGKLLKLENALFGTAGGDEGGGGRSLLRLRLDDWELGQLDSVPQGQPVQHPEVPRPVGANLYLGYGPIGGEKRSAISAAADAGVQLRLRCPEAHVEEIKAAIQLAHWFGTVGSRSRNGWGAIQFEGEGLRGIAELDSATLGELVALRPTKSCLSLDWPHALGSDGAPLVWRLLKVRPSREHAGRKELVGYESWEEVMHALARIKIAVRTADFFEFRGGGRDGHESPQPRHVLAYPAGSNHAVKAWGRDGRLANQVRFKVHRRRSNDFIGVIAHLPCALPARMAAATHGRLPDQVAVWTEVHRLLDAQKNNGLMRLKGV